MAYSNPFRIRIPGIKVTVIKVYIALDALTADGALAAARHPCTTHHFDVLYAY